MYRKKKIAVVVPAYNEEKLIGKVIKTMPSFVDRIFIIDDRSNDKTLANAKLAAKESKVKVILIEHTENQGVGGAIISGYKEAIKQKMDVTTIMAGDAQMDPEELKSLITPVIEEKADYVKGNRLIYGRAWKMIPKIRYMGNSILSLLTKIVSGYWHIADSQTGYLAISKKYLEILPLDKIYKGYGFENDMLVHLNIYRAKVKEIPIKPVYNIGEKSGIRLWKVIPLISWLLIKRFFFRLNQKYIIEDFHPLVFFYISSFILGFASIILLIRMIYRLILTNNLPPMNTLLFVFCVIMSFQFLFFAMWFDMDYNKELKA